MHLAPQLAADDILIMDNLNSHKVAGVREAVESMGARVLYLPPYSPDLNPIEQVFSKPSQLIDRFPPDECARSFRHCGYRYT